jgi:hypothetical protein
MMAPLREGKAQFPSNLLVAGRFAFRAWADFAEVIEGIDAGRVPV